MLKFVLGLVLGEIIGIGLTSLAASSKRADEQLEKMQHGKENDE